MKWQKIMFHPTINWKLNKISLQFIFWVYSCYNNTDTWNIYGIPYLTVCIFLHLYIWGNTILFSYLWHVTLLREQLENTPWRLLYQLQAAGVVSELNVCKIDLFLPVLEHKNTFLFHNRFERGGIHDKWYKKESLSFAHIFLNYKIQLERQLWRNETFQENLWYWLAAES